MESIAGFVEETRVELVKESDADSYAEYVHRRAPEATRLAFGLLWTGDVEEADRWFEAVAPLWAEGAAARTRRILESEDDDSGRLPFKMWYRGLLTAIMTRDRSIQIDVAVEIRDQIVDPRVDDLDGRDRKARADSCAGLAALLLGEPVDSHVERIRTHSSNESASVDPFVWQAEPFNEPQARILDGIERDDDRLITEGLRDLASFHEEHQVGNEQVHEMDRAIDAFTTAYVTLARQCGYDVRVESEYVPDIVYDETHFPLGETDS